MRKRISPATILAGVALFFSLGGAGAYAAQRYLITSASQIKPSVRAQLREAVQVRAVQGAQGATGPQGAQGPAGSVDFSRAQVVTATTKLEPSESNPTPTGSAIAVCPAGYDVLSGGFLNGPDVSVTSAFAKDPNEWVVTGRLAGKTGPETVQAWAECVPAS